MYNWIHIWYNFGDIIVIFLIFFEIEFQIFFIFCTCVAEKHLDTAHEHTYYIHSESGTSFTRIALEERISIPSEMLYTVSHKGGAYIYV